jgi:hypothetical protein
VPATGSGVSSLAVWSRQSSRGSSTIQATASCSSSTVLASGSCGGSTVPATESCSSSTMPATESCGGSTLLATGSWGSSTMQARVVRVVRVVVRCQRLVSGLDLEFGVVVRCKQLVSRLAATLAGGELAGKKEEEIWTGCYTSRRAGSGVAVRCKRLNLG